MIRMILLVAIIAIGVVSCSESKFPNRKTETLEIFSTKGSKNDKAVDSLRFFESTEYTDDKKIATSYFDFTGQLTGKEKLTYGKSGAIEEGAFYDPSGKLLSYYDYITNKEGDIIAEYGFDASNDALLSIKTFSYDVYGNVKVRKVFESDFTLYRRYDFSFDTKGNEKSMQVSNAKGEPVLTEQFNIVKRDSTGKWTEKWGFVNDSPVTFYKKSW